MPNKELEKKVQEHEEMVENGKAKNKKSTIKYVLNISLVLIATGLAIFFAIKDDAREIGHYLSTADGLFLLIILAVMAGFFSVLLTYLLESIISIKLSLLTKLVSSITRLLLVRVVAKSCKPTLIKSKACKYLVRFLFSLCILSFTKLS